MLTIPVSMGSVYAQVEPLPAFDGFSYMQDPVFGGANKAQDVSASVEKIAQPRKAGWETIEQDDEGASGVSMLSEADVYKLQLSLDKTLSKILKLTVDYDVLRTRVEKMYAASGKAVEFDSSVDISATEDEDQLRKLMELNNKQLRDRDQKIATLQERLATSQGRFDSENVTRLKAEKSLKTVEDRRKNLKLKLIEKNQKLELFGGQLEASQQHVMQLEAELAVQRSIANEQPPESQDSERVEPGVETDDIPAQFRPAEEWVINGLEFELGSAEINLNSIASLTELTEHLLKNPGLSVLVNGYTDSVGSADSNLQLSQARADSVAEYLVQQGIAQTRIRALGYGELRPFGDNQTEQGRVLNRRVAVLFLR